MILFLSIYDWANQGRTMAKAVNKAGGKAIAASLNHLTFNGENDENVVRSFQELRTIISLSSDIVFMHSNPNFTKLPIDVGDSNLYVFHGGSQYRNNPVLLNSIFNPVVNRSLIQTPDLLGLGAINEVFISNGIDILEVQAVIEPERDDRITIGFFPSNAGIKGDGTVLPVLRTIDKEFPDVRILSTNEPVPHEVVLQMMQACDIIVDGVKPAIGCKQYGEWGVQALEAAAMGKVVFTHSLRDDIYRDHFGGHPLMICNNGITLYESLKKMLKHSTRTQIKKRGGTTRAWCERNHGLKSFGKRILEAMGV